MTYAKWVTYAKDTLPDFMLPMSITILDLSAYVGLLAVGVITLNMLLGLLMAFRYSRTAPGHIGVSITSAFTTGPATSL